MQGSDASAIQGRAHQQENGLQTLNAQTSAGLCIPANSHLVH